MKQPSILRVALFAMATRAWLEADMRGQWRRGRFWKRVAVRLSW